MFNGQWLGQVSPLTVDEFKVVSSPKTAAYAFELNFERPAAAHQKDKPMHKYGMTNSKI